GPVLRQLIVELGKHPQLDCHQLLVGKLDSTNADVRAAAVASLANLKAVEAGHRIAALLSDSNETVRRAAATAVGRLGLKSSVAQLLKLANDPDPFTRSASLESLRLLKEASAVPVAVAALEHPATQLAALDYLDEFGQSAQASEVANVISTSRSLDVLTSAIR